MITVSERAKDKLMEIKHSERHPEDAFLRVGVDGGGCSGLTYQLHFDTSRKEDDKVFTDNGIEIVVSKKSFLYLVGTELDFSDGLNGKGFQFNNPNATRTCGCGESFSI
jgi:iron-sulfur cluster assembly protein